VALKFLPEETSLGAHQGKQAIAMALIALLLFSSLAWGQASASPGGGASNSENFTVDNRVPTITRLSPSSATAGAAAQTLTISGTNFLSTSTVRYNSVEHTARFVNSTELTISLSATDQATAGNYAVVVTNPSPGGGASNSENFTVDNRVPTITRLSPSSATAGAAAQTLTISGTNFLSTSTVRYNRVEHAARFVNSTELTISLSATDQATAGSYAVVVRNPSPGGGASNSENFTVSGAVISLSATSLAFGNEGVDRTSSPPSVTLKNTGNATLSDVSIAVRGTNANDFPENNTCGRSVAAGRTCTIVVLFRPSATGSRTASVRITDHASSGPQTVSLMGRGMHDVILTWDASISSGLVGYKIYRRTTSGRENWKVLNSIPIKDNTFVDGNDVVAGDTYHYVVKAVALDGSQSADSNEASVTVPPR
jgi:hypothetical protein